MKPGPAPYCPLKRSRASEFESPVFDATKVGIHGLRYLAGDLSAVPHSCGWECLGGIMWTSGIFLICLFVCFRTSELQSASRKSIFRLDSSQERLLNQVLGDGVVTYTGSHKPEQLIPILLDPALGVHSRRRCTGNRR